MTEALTPCAAVLAAEAVRRRSAPHADGPAEGSPEARPDEPRLRSRRPPARQTTSRQAVHAIADRSRQAARRLARANRAWKDRALRAIADALRSHDRIVAANAKDVDAPAGPTARPRACWTGSPSPTRASRPSPPPWRPRRPAGSGGQGGARPDPAQRPADAPGRVPMGVVAMIYEARPNVTVDTAGLAPQERQRRHPARRHRRCASNNAPGRTSCGRRWIGGPARGRGPDRRPVRTATAAEALMRARGLVDVLDSARRRAD